MTEEIRYIANLQRQEEFDNEVTELEAELKRLEQVNKELIEDNLNLSKENGELKAYKDVNEDFKKAWDELNEKYKLLRSALEEIKGTVQKGICSLRKGYSREYQDTLSNIFNKINEVLK